MRIDGGVREAAVHSTPNIKRAFILQPLTLCYNHNTAPQSQQTLSAYFTSKQMLPFGFARQYNIAAMAITDASSGILQEKTLQDSESMFV